MSDLWRSVAFSLGGNDRWGDCAFVACANLLDLWAAKAGAPWIIGEAECERLYALEAGFNSQDKATDTGAVLEDVIRYWCEHGWPADPLEKPTGCRAVGPGDFAAAIVRNDGLPCWAILPAIGDDVEIFGDGVLGDEPADGHAMLIVEANAAGLTLITWAESRRVSWAWWRRFGRGAFEVTRPAP